MALNDREPTREIGVGLGYRLRVKRHRGGHVRSYPTPTFLDFQLQGVQLVFPGMDEVRLNVGYRWDAVTRSIGEPVISLPHGDEMIWIRALDGAEPDVVGRLPRQEPGPTAPVVELVEETDDTAPDGEG